jgi:hypothetical protein
MISTLLSNRAYGVLPGGLETSMCPPQLRSLFYQRRTQLLPLHRLASMDRSHFARLVPLYKCKQPRYCNLRICFVRLVFIVTKADVVEFLQCHQ